jgi:hypothetical protein
VRDPEEVLEGDLRAAGLRRKPRDFRDSPAFFWCFLVGAYLAFAAVLVVPVWIGFFADCRTIGFLPLSSTPARCLDANLGGRR